ncbi:hypothetical protein [Microvirga sp. VF16]|uniref:hypothetical protein n=1 Tax=Microvirga sp. VF16 TaxID=2807101 RepID=UPI00193CD25F|nr:hypothetical protein [Microvirga sp. VF16]QRM27359.1 hypothetical protein JO965_13715 [Microvirga sp. VF16]
MFQERERQCEIDAVEAEATRQVRRLGVILALLMVLAVLALAVVLGQLLEIPWLSYSQQDPA